jgi:hypothetical protein
MEELSTYDLLELTNSDHLIFMFKTLCPSFTKQGTLMSRSTVRSLPLQAGLSRTGIKSFITLATGGARLS